MQYRSYKSNKSSSCRSASLQPVLCAHLHAAAPTRRCALRAAAAAEDEQQQSDTGAAAAYKRAAAVAAAASAAAFLATSGAAAWALPAPPCFSTTGLLQPPVQPWELPAARPPDWESAAAAAAAPPLPAFDPPQRAGKNRAAGALTARVVHSPIAGVTPAMLRWWFEGGVEGVMTHPQDGREYARYLVWHPRDHIRQSTLAAGPNPGSAAGARWLIVEFFGASRGWVAGDAACAWRGELWTKSSLAVARLDGGGLTLEYRPPPWVPAVVARALPPPVRLTHEWAPSDEGAVLVSTLTIGLPPARNGDGDGAAADSPAARFVTAVAQRAFGGNDAEGALRAWQEHCAEEFANLRFFLPQLYVKETGTGVGR